jgi:hypothetical protein
VYLGKALADESGAMSANARREERKIIFFLRMAEGYRVRR